MSFQENLRRAREKAGFESAKDFAQNILGIKYTTYLAYEGQEGREPKYDLLCQIAQKLGTSPNELLGYDPGKYEKYKHLVQAAGFFVEDSSSPFPDTRPTGDQVYVSYEITPDDDDYSRVDFESKEAFIRAIDHACNIYSQNTEKVLYREIGIAILDRDPRY